MYRTYCDLCGEEITRENEGRAFKIKEFKPFPSKGKWEEIEVHRECVMALINACKEQKNEVGRNVIGGAKHAY